MPTTTAIALTTAADESSIIPLTAGQTIQVYTSIPLLDGELVTLERTPDAGESWILVSDEEYSGRVLEVGRTSAIIAGPGNFRLVKTETEVQVAVFFDD